MLPLMVAQHCGVTEIPVQSESTIVTSPAPEACRYSTPDVQRHEHESLGHNLTPDGYCDVEIEYSGKNLQVSHNSWFRCRVL